MPLAPSLVRSGAAAEGAELVVDAEMEVPTGCDDLSVLVVTPAHPVRVAKPY